jgi:hypothetical protein
VTKPTTLIGPEPASRASPLGVADVRIGSKARRFDPPLLTSGPPLSADITRSNRLVRLVPQPDALT